MNLAPLYGGDELFNDECYNRVYLLGDMSLYDVVEHQWDT